MCSVCKGVISEKYTTIIGSVLKRGQCIRCKKLFCDEHIDLIEPPGVFYVYTRCSGCTNYFDKINTEKEIKASKWDGKYYFFGNIIAYLIRSSKLNGFEDK